jgi:hypothetical protein
MPLSSVLGTDSISFTELFTPLFPHSTFHASDPHEDITSDLPPRTRDSLAARLIHRSNPLSSLSHVAHPHLILCMKTLLLATLLLAAAPLFAAPFATTINREPQTTLAVVGTSTVFRVTFNAIVTGVDVTDFTLVKIGTVNGTIASVSGSGTTYDVTVNSITGFGQLRLDLKGSGTGIVDGAAWPSPRVSTMARPSRLAPPHPSAGATTVPARWAMAPPHPPGPSLSPLPSPVCSAAKTLPV